MVSVFHRGHARSPRRALARLTVARWQKLRRLLQRDVRVDVEDELRFHLEARTADYQAQGLSSTDAERAARDRFGDPEVIRHALEIHDAALRRREHRREYMSDLLQDLRFAARALRRTPGFTLAVLATLAVGIGANTAVFSVVSRELLDPLPYHDANRVMMLYTADARHADGRLSPNQIDRLQRASRTLSSVAAFGNYGGVTYVGDQQTVTWQSASVGPEFFRTLGVTPIVGRLIDDRDVAPGAPPTVVLGNEVWRQDFASDSSIVGRKIRVNEVDWTVIGVLRSDFTAPARAPQVWTALDTRRGLGTPMANAYYYQVVARMADGATPDQLAAELRVLALQPGAKTTTGFPSTIIAVPVRDAIVGDAKAVLLVVMGAALLVLLLACVNVAGLFFARATARRREIAVRTALGAGRWRIARQIVTESTLLGVAGGACGVVLAVWGEHLLIAVGAAVLPRTGLPPSIDGRVVAFGAAASLAVGAIAGLVPALFRDRSDLASAFGESGRSAAGSRGHTRVGRVLVAGQMSLAILLLVGAGLLGRTLVALENADMGYDAGRNVLSLFVTLPRSYATAEAQTAFFTAWLDRVRALPGVRAASAIGIGPWNGWNYTVVHLGSGDSVTAPLGLVADGYFKTVRTRVLTGRAFEATDRAGSVPVVIVSDRLARASWPERSALGQRVRIGDDTTWRTVVGVVADVRESPSSAAEASIYEAAWQAPQRWFEVLIRGDADGMALVAEVRESLRAMDRTVPSAGARTMDQVLLASVAGQRLPALFTSAFAMLALVLAVLGMYGVLAYTVTLRTRELGIRAALGGTRASILALVLVDGLTTAVAGTAFGVAIALVAARLLASVLYGVSPHDPMAFIAAVTVLLAASVAACLVPARRATRVDPVAALRAE